MEGIRIMFTRARAGHLTAAAAGIVLAGAVGLGGTARPAAAQSAAPSEAEIEAKEIAAVGAAKVGLAEAIAAAEKQLGGKVVAAGMEVEADRLFYDLLVSRDRGLTGVRVDPATGVVSSAGEAGGGQGQAMPPKNAKIDLGQAVRLAEAAAGRKALEAGIEQQEGAAVYVVEIVEDGEVSVRRVDPVSGQVSPG
jgi:uncharacterized membrane protein YkoI